VTVAIDNEPVLIGWVDDVETDFAEGSATVSIAGRDKTGDLADCACGPKGPVEWRNLDVLAFAKEACKPFGISVRAEVDVGAKFPKLGIDASETVLTAIEKYARQRQLLVLSDGIGGLVLTRTGATRAAGVVMPGAGLLRSNYSTSHRERFSDVFVKGQVERAGGTRGDASLFNPQAVPGEATAPANEEARGIKVSGLARDTEVTRWRPKVLQTRSAPQPGGKKPSAQVQAEGYVKTQRAKGDELNVALQDWRAGGGLWKPNTLVPVMDPFAGVSADLLIANVRFSYSESDGHVTELRLVDPSTYDDEPEGEQQAHRASRKAASGASPSADVPAGATEVNFF
jgi:prophage tail gpP-like protein